MTSKMEIITFKLPKEMIVEIDALVHKGLFNSRSDAIRYAIGMLITRNTSNVGNEIKNANTR